MERVFKDVVSRLRVEQFNKINGLNLRYKTPNITDYLLSFSPIHYPLSKDGYFSYLDPCEVNIKFNKPFVRRLWGGGSMKLYAPLQFDKEYLCIETIKRARETSNGVFLTLERNMFDKSNQQSLLVEVRTLAYSNSKPIISSNNPIPSLSLRNWKLVDSIRFNEENIIKYGILSSNPHRIHWDKTYTTTVEGYENIIVPGPYISQLITNLVEKNMGHKLTNIKYRNINFIYPDTPLNLYCDSNSKIFWLSNTTNPNLIYFILNIND